MGSGERFAKKGYNTPSPGPKYDVRGRHWVDVTTITPKNNAARFNTGPRFAKDPQSGGNTGPGQYNRKDTAIKIDPSKAPR